MNSRARIAIPLLLSFVLLPGHFTVAADSDLRAFGVVGDGKTDDAAAIQKAVNAGLGGLRFPKGVYRLTKTVVIDLDKVGFTSLAGDGTARIVMAGAGPAFKFVGTHGGSADPNQFKPNVWERQRAPMIDGIEIVGAHPEADGIESSGVMQLTITRVVIREARHAIHLVERDRNVLIADCHFYHNRGIGVFLDQVNLHQINVTGCHISYNAGGGIVSRGGNVRNLHIGNCDIESNMATNTPPTANVLLDSAGGSIGEVAITGCTIQHNNPSPDSANIRILGEGKDAGTARATGSDKTQEGHITITGNVLSDVQVNIHLRHARGVTITGNTMWEGYAHDLLVENCNNVIVGPNNLDRNPRYGVYPQRNSKLGVVFRDSRDCTITGLQVHGVRGQPATVHLERCDRFNIANCTILDSDGIGLWLDGVTRTRVAGCVIRDDREGRAAAPSLQVTGGRENWLTDNWLVNGSKVAAGAAQAERNREGR